MREETLQLIGRGRLIAIMRGNFGDRIDCIGETLAEAGVYAMELTMNSPGVFTGIERLARRLGTSVAVGVGTVRTEAEVVRAAAAGATFVVSPECDVSVIAATRRQNLVSLPGCFTPSEIARAIEAGADAVKLFPACSLGPAFVRAINGPRPNLRTVPTGGITLDSAMEWLEMGAWALGVGGELIGHDLEMVQLRARAEEFVALCRTTGV